MIRDSTDINLLQRLCRPGLGRGNLSLTNTPHEKTFCIPLLHLCHQTRSTKFTMRQARGPRWAKRNPVHIWSIPFWWHSLASHLRSQSTAAHEMWRIGREPLRAPAESPSHGRHFGSFAAVARPIQHQDHHLRAEVHLESASSARLSEALRPKPWSRAVLCYPCWAERTWLQLGFNSSRRKAKKVNGSVLSIQKGCKK